MTHCSKERVCFTRGHETVNRGGRYTQGMKKMTAALALALLMVGAGNQEKKARPFAMGVTPFPYELTPEAVEATQLWILDNTDLVAIKLDEGIPWQEALENKNSYDPAFESSLDWKGKKPQDKKVFLS